MWLQSLDDCVWRLCCFLQQISKKEGKKKKIICTEVLKWVLFMQTLMCVSVTDCPSWFEAACVWKLGSGSRPAAASGSCTQQPRQRCSQESGPAEAAHPATRPGQLSQSHFNSTNIHAALAPWILMLTEDLFLLKRTKTAPVIASLTILHDRRLITSRARCNRETSFQVWSNFALQGIGNSFRHRFHPFLWVCV